MEDTFFFTLSVVLNCLLFFFLCREIKRETKLIGDCFYFMDEIVLLKEKINKLEKK